MADLFNNMIASLAQDTGRQSQVTATKQQLSKVSGQNKKVDAAAKEFESVFIAEMLKPMFDTVPVDSEFGGGNAEEVYRGLMVQEYAKHMSNAGGIGLASSIKAQMLAMQEGQ